VLRRQGGHDCSSVRLAKLAALLIHLLLPDAHAKVALPQSRRNKPNGACVLALYDFHSLAHQLALRLVSHATPCTTTTTAAAAFFVATRRGCGFK